MKRITAYKLLDGTIVEDLNDALNFAQFEIARKAFYDLYQKHETDFKEQSAYHGNYIDLIRKEDGKFLFAFMINYIDEYIEIYNKIKKKERGKNDTSTLHLSN